MIKRCERCSASWMDGQHYWANGNRGTVDTIQSELDLAGLVCNPIDSDQCINPCKGQPGGQTWEDRMKQANVYGVLTDAVLKAPPIGQ